MHGLDIYDREGAPITMEEWSQLIVDLDYKHVTQEYVNDWWVSTVWLGMSHGTDTLGRPLIFETMIFAPTAGPEGPEEWLGEAMDCIRYATIEEAEEGHAEAVLMASAIDHSRTEIEELRDLAPDEVAEPQSAGDHEDRG